MTTAAAAAAALTSFVIYTLRRNKNKADKYMSELITASITSIYPTECENHLQN